MNAKKNILESKKISYLKAIWKSSVIDSKGKVVNLLVLMLVAAALEAASAGLILPFVAVISNSDYLYNQPFIIKVIDFFGFESENSFKIGLTIFLLFYFVLKNLFLAFVTKYQYTIIYKEMQLTSTRIFSNYLAKPYDYHIKTNSSVMIRNISNEVQMFYTNVFASILLVFNEIAVVFAITGLLLWIAPMPTLITILILIGSILLIDKFIRLKVKHYGQQQQNDYAMRIKCINHGLGGIKEIKVFNRENYFINAFEKYEQSYAASMKNAMVLSQIPRLFIETVAYTALFIAVLAVLIFGGETMNLLPTLALFAVAAVRLMPSLNRIQSGVNRINYYWPSVLVVSGGEDNNNYGQIVANVDNINIDFKKEISIQNISYTYNGALKPTLKEINLQIPKGSSVAITGASGSGKTTLVDIILGLINPDSGKIYVDGRDISLNISGWRKKLAYVPQTIFLSDDTIRKNVAFGVEDKEIDDIKIWQALEQAHLTSYVKDLDKGLDTLVGERGVNMSGGQRQRLGLARALYNEADVLVLDEATSALDKDTEKEVSLAINSLAGKKTLIIIAHRLSTIKNCDINLKL
jgi:ABC-type multidrug transport system fused ATPase/permease subunit